MMFKKRTVRASILNARVLFSSDKKDETNYLKKYFILTGNDQIYFAAAHPLPREATCRRGEQGSGQLTRAHQVRATLASHDERPSFGDVTNTSSFLLIGLSDNIDGACDFNITYT